MLLVMFTITSSTLFTAALGLSPSRPVTTRATPTGSPITYAISVERSVI